jgi:hypothetical protein
MRRSTAVRWPPAQVPPTVPSQHEARRAQSPATKPAQAPPPTSRAVVNRRPTMLPSSHHATLKHEPGRRPQAKRSSACAPRRHHATLKHEPGRQAPTTSTAAQPDEEGSHRRQTREPRLGASDSNAGKGAEEESPVAALLVSRSGCVDDAAMGWIRRHGGARVYPARVTSAGDTSGTLLSRCGCERYHNLLVIINLSTG